MDWPGESLRKTASASLASRSFPRQAWIPAGIRCAPLRILDIFRIADHRPITNGTRKRKVSDRDGDKVATSQLAFDGEIKQRQIAFRTRHLQSRPDAPDLSWLKRRLLANNVAPVPARQGPSPMPPSTAAAPNASSRIVAPLEPSITFKRLLISARATSTAIGAVAPALAIAHPPCKRRQQVQDRTLSTTPALRSPSTTSSKSSGFL